MSYKEFCEGYALGLSGAPLPWGIHEPIEYRYNFLDFSGVYPVDIVWRIFGFASQNANILETLESERFSVGEFPFSHKTTYTWKTTRAQPAITNGYSLTLNPIVPFKRGDIITIKWIFPNVEMTEMSTLSQNHSIQFGGDRVNYNVDSDDLSMFHVGACLQPDTVEFSRIYNGDNVVGLNFKGQFLSGQSSIIIHHEVDDPDFILRTGDVIVTYNSYDDLIMTVTKSEVA